MWARRDSNPRPPASEGAEGAQQRLANVANGAEGFENSEPAQSSDAVAKGGFRRDFATPLLQGFGGAEGAAELLTVREVAAVLRLCTATVYRICERGELAHVRVANAVRVSRRALKAYLGVRR
jgi:excisionase family DNA binding protein